MTDQERLEKPYYWNDEEPVSHSKMIQVCGRIPAVIKKAARQPRRVVCECGLVFYTKTRGKRTLCNDCQVTKMTEHASRNKKNHYRSRKNK
jgi:hypothetical protein